MDIHEKQTISNEWWLDRHRNISFGNYLRKRFDFSKVDDTLNIFADSKKLAYARYWFE